MYFYHIRNTNVLIVAEKRRFEPDIIYQEEPEIIMVSLGFGNWNCIFKELKKFKEFFNNLLC